MNCYLILLMIIVQKSVCHSDNHYHEALWTQYVQGHHDHAQAAQCYTILFNNNPSVHLYPTFIEHLFNTNGFKGITELATHLEPHICLNKQQTLMVAESFLKIGNTQEATKRLETLAAESYNNVEMILKIAQLYAGLKDYNRALGHLSMFLEQSSHQAHHAIVYFTKAHLYFQLNNCTLAKQNALKSIELNPNLEQAWLLLAFVYNKEHNTIQARHCYDKYTSLAGADC